MKKILFLLFISIFLLNSCNDTSNPVIATTPTTITYEGITYNIVQIGSQSWLKENLNIGTMLQGNQNQTNNGIIEKFCYNDDTANCNKFGGLYQWNEAIQYTTSGTKGICPTGWHIPTNIEFQTLATTVGNDGNALKAVGQGTGNGTGTDTSGFSALLGGYSDGNGGFGGGSGYGSYIWGAPGTSTATQSYMSLMYNDNIIHIANPYTNFGFSVRCIKD